MFLSLSLSASMKIQLIKEEVKSIVEAAPVIGHLTSIRPKKLLKSLKTNIYTQNNHP